MTTKADAVPSLLDKILGRPLKASEASKEKLTVATGVPVLGLDALASTAYGPEAAAAILLPLGGRGRRCGIRDTRASASQAGILSHRSRHIDVR